MKCFCYLVYLVFTCCFVLYVQAQLQFGGGSRTISANRNRQSSSSGCITVGGPTVGATCVFPFKHRGITYHGCPKDPDDSSKYWCSVRVDASGKHMGGIGAYGHCGSSCPKHNQNDFSRSKLPSTGGQQQLCLTVSGPSANQACHFPFIYRGKTFFGCPVDPVDPTKRWCSTRVYPNNTHVTGQNAYGHCATNCPLHNEDDSQPGVPSFIGGGGSAPISQQSSSCSGRDKCRSFSACAPQQSVGSAKRCIQNDGSVGLCCKDIVRNPSNSFLSVRSISGTDLSSVPQQQVSQAVDMGQSFAQNVTVVTRQFGRNSNIRKGSPEFFHYRFLKSKKEARTLSQGAFTAAFAARSLNKVVGNSNDVNVRQGGFTNADTSRTILSSDCPPTPFCQPNARYRSQDGSCNNLRQPKFGMALTPLQRVLGNAYFDGIIMPRRAADGTSLPSARVVSNTVVSLTASPSNINTALLMAVGQFIDHDITLVPMQDNGEGSPLECCSSNNKGFGQDTATSSVCFPITVPRNDPFFQGKRNCINFVRSRGSLDLQCQPGPFQQINQITHWLDSSNVYGSEEKETRHLRTFNGGLMLTQRASDGGDLLPQDTSNECAGGPSSRCFLAGDERVNEQPTLATMHTLFVREHNRIARELVRINPRWSSNDELVFQETKKIVNAEWQHIIYNEWLPIVLGDQFMTRFGLFPLTDGHSKDYRNDFDPRITNAFATAAFRIGHTLIPGLIQAFSGQRLTRSLELRQAFGNMDLLKERNMVDRLLKGLTIQAVEGADNNFVDDVVNHLFEADQSNGIGLDLVALNIQRGRDHGLPGYVEYRRICQIGRADSFDDLNSNISPKNIQLLRRTYKRVEDVDLFIGMSMEQPARQGAVVGETFLCLIGDQFARLKKGDRYFYDLGGQAGSFSLNQLTEIRKTSLARLICDNTNEVTEVQPLALQKSHPQNNPITECDSRLLLLGIPHVSFDAWRQ